MNYKDIKIKKSERFGLQRRVVSYMTSESWHNVPHVTYVYEPDITDFYEEYLKLAKRVGNSGVKISFNTLMLKVIIEGLLSAPDLNSYVEYNHKKSEGIIHILDQINISLPWLLPDGRMITPVIPDCGEMTLNEISKYIADLSSRIEKTNINELLYKAAFTDTVDKLKKLNFSILRRILATKVTGHRIYGLKSKNKAEYYKIPVTDRLTEKDIMSGTVTVSNVGSLYKEQRGFFGLLEIIPPQALAIGLGAVQEKPGIYILETGNKEIGIRKVLPMCLAFDHRAVDFNSIVPFLKRLDEIFQNPSIIHAW